MARNQIVVISEEEIFNIHELMLQRDGGLPGLRRGASLSAVVERIHNHAIYDPDYRDPWRLSALLAYAITVGHPFNDANKRTALTASVAMLKCNGCVQPEPSALAAGAGADIHGDVSSSASAQGSFSTSARLR